MKLQTIQSAALVILMATASVQALANAKSAHPTNPDLRCSLPEGWAAVVLRHPDYVVFGELHGTRQAPEFIGKLACALAVRGQSVLVGLELAAPDNDAIQVAWRLPRRQFPAALRKAGWIGQLDGVYSRAMFSLVVRLHGLAQNDHRIAVVAFDPDDAQEAQFASMSGQDPHEAAQAKNIRNAATAEHADWVLVLAGNIHARKRPMEREHVFHPMAMQLAPATRLISLNVASAGGTMWNCVLRPGFSSSSGEPVTTNALDCGNHHIKGDAAFNRPPFISMGSLPGQAFDPAYDGYFWLGPIEGSPPEIPESRKAGSQHR